MRSLRTPIVIVSACAATVTLGGGAAHAGFTPAWSYVPATLRAKLATQGGGSLYLPARTPLFYRYRAGATVENGQLSVPFTNRVRVRQGVWRWTSATFAWRTAPLHGACTAWSTVDKTLQVSGNKVYWSAADRTAWRCVTDKRSHALVLSASFDPTNNAQGDLSTVVASGLDVSGRTSAVTVSLAVTPTKVRRGGSVLVRGVAGGCTSGDTVTIISHAFAATHSFAGVPAVFAQVGSAGRFSATGRIPGTRAPGTYVLTARCGGGNLGVAAHLTVTR